MMRMRKILIDGIYGQRAHAVNTNFNGAGGGYPLGKGNDKKGYKMKTPKLLLRDGDTYAYPECAKEMFHRLVEEGYTTIRFEEVATSVRGYHNIVAYVKNREDFTK